MKQALSKQKKPFVVGLILTLLVSAITFGADYLEVNRHQELTAKEQADALVTRLNVVTGELRAASAFMEQSNRSLYRFDEFSDRLSGEGQNSINWAVAATADPERGAAFANWIQTLTELIDRQSLDINELLKLPNIVLLATGEQNGLAPGKSIVLPKDSANASGPFPVSNGELTRDHQREGLWLVLSSKPAEVQDMNGVSKIITLRKVSIDQLRTFAGLSPLQKMSIGWFAKSAPDQITAIGATDVDRLNGTKSKMTLGTYNLEFAIDRPPRPDLPRTWLLLLLAGAATTAFWVSWRTAGTLNVRAGALAEAIEQTSGKLRVIHDKESAFFENAGTPQCEVDPDTGRFLRVNKALCNWLGYDAGELMQKTAYEVSAQEDVAVTHMHVEKTKSSPQKLLQLEKRYVTKTGSKIWGLVTSNLFNNPITGDRVFLTTIIDITGRKEADAMRDRLLRELAHRVRNTMQLTDSLARQSAVGAKSAKAYALDFRNRLAALSRAQDVLFETNWVSADMRELAHRVIRPFDNGKIKIDLPIVELPPQHAQTFALALHELISQSAERGAVKIGKPIELTGELEGFDELGIRKLTLTWKETFPSRSRKVDNNNFGNSMLHVALPRQFDGDAESLLTSRGFTYVARLTLPEE